MSDSDSSSDSESELQKIKRQRANKRKRTKESDDDDNDDNDQDKHGSKHKVKKSRLDSIKSKNKTRKKSKSQKQSTLKSGKNKTRQQKQKQKTKSGQKDDQDTSDSDNDSDNDNGNEKKKDQDKQHDEKRVELSIKENTRDSIPMQVDSDSSHLQESSEMVSLSSLSTVLTNTIGRSANEQVIKPGVKEPVVSFTNTLTTPMAVSSMPGPVPLPLSLPNVQSSRSPTANILASLRPSTMMNNTIGNGNGNGRGQATSPVNFINGRASLVNVEIGPVSNTLASRKTTDVELLLPPPLPISTSPNLPVLDLPNVLDVGSSSNTSLDGPQVSTTINRPLGNGDTKSSLVPVVSSAIIDESDAKRTNKAKKNRDTETKDDGNASVDAETGKAAKTKAPPKAKESDADDDDEDDDDDDKNSDSENEPDENDGNGGDAKANKKSKSKKKKKNQRKKSSRRKHGQTSSSHHVTSKIYTAEELHEIAHADSPPPPPFVANPPAFIHSLSKCSIHKIPDALPIMGYRFYFEDKRDKTAPKDKIIHLGDEFTMPKGCKTPNVVKLRLKLKNPQDEAEFAKMYKKEEIRIFASTIKNDLKSIATMIQPCHIGDIEDGRGTYERQHQFIHYRGKCWHLNCTLVNHIDSRFRVKALLRNNKNYEFYAICINRNRRINGRSRIYDDVYYRQNKIQTELPVYTISKVIAGRFLSYKKKVTKAEEARKKKKASKNAASLVPIPLPHIQTILTRDALEKQAASANKTSKQSSGNGHGKTSKHTASASSPENGQHGRGSSSSSKTEHGDSTDSHRERDRDKTKHNGKGLSTMAMTTTTTTDGSNAMPRLEDQGNMAAMNIDLQSSSISSASSLTLPLSLPLPLSFVPTTSHSGAATIMARSDSKLVNALDSGSSSIGSGSGSSSNSVFASNPIKPFDLAALTETEQATLSLLSKSANTFEYLTLVDHKIQDGTDRAKTMSNMLNIRSKMEMITRPMMQLIENASKQQPSIVAKLLSSFANVETTEQFKRLFQDENGWFSFCMIHAILTDRVALPIPDFSTYKARLTRMLQTGGTSME